MEILVQLTHRGEMQHGSRLTINCSQLHSHEYEMRDKPRV